MISFDNFATDTSTRVFQDYVAFPEFQSKDEERSFEDLAKKINKRVNGSQFKLITEPKEFVEPYKKRIQTGLKSTDPEECAFACSYNFDLEEIKSPKLDKGRLVFYVHSKHGKFPIPQRVTCDNPNSLQNVKVTCEVLPYITPSL